MRRSWLTRAVVTGMLAIAAPSNAQERAPILVTASPYDHDAVTGVVHGIVRDDEGRGIPGAILRLGSRELRTADNGVFVFDHVPPGQYTLQARAAGHFGYLVYVSVEPGPSGALVIEAVRAPVVPVVQRRSETDRTAFLRRTPRFWNPITFGADTLARVRAASVTAWLDGEGLLDQNALSAMPHRALDTTWANTGHVSSAGNGSGTERRTLGVFAGLVRDRPPLPQFQAQVRPPTAAFGLRAAAGGFSLDRYAPAASEVEPLAGLINPLEGALQTGTRGVHFETCRGIMTFLNGRPMPPWVLDAAAPSDFETVDVSRQFRLDGPCEIVALWTPRVAASRPVPAASR